MLREEKNRTGPAAGPAHNTNTREGVLILEVYTRPTTMDDPPVAMHPNIRAVQDAVSLQDYLLERGAQINGKRCICPVHQGTNAASFALYDDHAHCFSCGWHGGVIKLHAELESMAFWEALIDLAQKYNVELPGRPGSWHRKQERQQPIRDQIDAERVEHIRLLVFRLIWTPWLKRLPGWMRAEARETAWKRSRSMALSLYEGRREV